MTGMKHLIALLLLTGCASTQVVYDNQGRSALRIDCTDQGGWDVCYREAIERCPSGYVTLSRRGEGVTQAAALTQLGQSNLREMTIRCK
jgi:hypothetical protein